MFPRHHLSAPTILNREVGRLGACQCVITVSMAMGEPKKCHPAINKAVEGGNAMKKDAGGLKIIITPEEDRYASLVAKKNRNVIPSHIATDLAIVTGTHNSARTFHSD